MTLISSEDSAHDFIVKFSPSVCTCCSFLDQRRGCTKLLTMLMEQILLLSMAMTKNH